MIEIENATKIFGAGATAFTALRGVDVSISENEFFTLLGPSGCGKTTLLRLIAGFELPTRGSIRLDGKDITQMPPNRRSVNTVFQNYALFPHMTVAKNIAFGLEMLGKPTSEVKSKVDEMLRLVKLEDLRDRRISEMSGGQQQRVALARALAPHPKVLLLDEPLSALDLKLRKEMQVELKRIQSETGITFVFVTHDQDEALSMSDRIAVMNGGQILQIGTPREIYQGPKERFVAAFIGESNFLKATVSRNRVTLKAGGTFDVDIPEGITDGEVSVLVRPEHCTVALSNAGAGEISGRIESVVYSGEATHARLKLATGESLAARLTNTPHTLDACLETGAAVTVSILPGAVTVVRD